jgi:hypothetical protein
MAPMTTGPVRQAVWVLLEVSALAILGAGGAGALIGVIAQAAGASP